MKGIIEFYEAFTRGFPDFQITVHTEHDVPGVSIREAQIAGIHNGSTAEFRQQAPASRFH
jgi:hypothetical protein